MMDFIFYLDDQSLQQIMRSIVIPLGWTYIALWLLDQQAPELACKDGWFNPEMETGSSTGQSLGLTFFNLYKLCRFALDAGVPGLALNQPPYVWLTANELLCFSSDESQKQFYKVAGIQTAVFIPCGIGVIELGTTTLVQADEQNKLRISSLLGSLIMSPNISAPMPGTSISTSSCSSLPSRSIDSPESSSMVSYLQYPTITTSGQINMVPTDTQQYSMPASELATGFYPYLQTLQLPSSSSSSGLLITGHDQWPGSSQQISASNLLLFPQTTQASGFPVAPSSRNMMLGAFSTWRPPSQLVSPPVVQGQYKLKRCLTILRNIHAQKLEQISMAGSYRPQGGTVSSSQVHHMISERKRREKLKESFEALRSFFPRGGRKDKASILSYTKEYLTSLKSRVEVLEQKNKQLESELNKLTRVQSQEGAGTSTALQQHGSTSAGTSTALQQHGSTSAEGGHSVVTVEASKIGETETEIVVVVERPTNTIDLMIAVLRRLREMGVPLISMATSTAHPENDPSGLQFRMTATIKLQDQELERVKEGLVNAVKREGGPPPPPPPSQ